MRPKKKSVRRLSAKDEKFMEEAGGKVCKVLGLEGYARFLRLLGDDTEPWEVTRRRLNKEDEKKPWGERVAALRKANAKYRRWLKSGRAAPPRPPEELVGALHDRIHRETGPGREEREGRGDEVTPAPWPAVGTEVPCWCGGTARVFERPFLDASPPGAMCPAGHLVVQVPDGAWRDFGSAMLMTCGKPGPRKL